MGRWRAWSQFRQLKASSRRSSSPSPRPISASLDLLPRLQTHGFSSRLLRLFSTISAVSDSYDGGFGVGHHEHIQKSEWDSHEDEGTSRYIPVKAYFLSTRSSEKQRDSDWTAVHSRKTQQNCCLQQFNSGISEEIRKKTQSKICIPLVDE
ncbi:hypothetical protein MA16_Dca012196 [Dendrobium catenatum]|uniref:Uncharacterized protein n=1 Tax=Dendrobium catenatum TaxID=906689 RepID=A0A2I0VPY0_9ASPA|nr:hypothetical protein MA16_Dca012196 [Dendrobium catenatum]